MVAGLASGVAYGTISQESYSRPGTLTLDAIISHHLWFKFVLGVYIFNLVLALNSSVLSVLGPDKSSQTQTGVVQEM